MQVFIVKFRYKYLNQEHRTIVAVKATLEEANDYISRTGKSRNNFLIETWEVGAEEAIK